jgi:hypothetical protein
VTGWYKLAVILFSVTVWMVLVPFALFVAVFPESSMVETIPSPKEEIGFSFLIITTAIAAQIATVAIYKRIEEA